MAKVMKDVKPYGRYQVLGESGADVTVTSVTSKNYGSDDGLPEIVLYCAKAGYNGGPSLIYQGHDLGSKPFTGSGKTPEDAVTDLLRVINDQVSHRMDVTDLVRILIKEKDAV